MRLDGSVALWLGLSRESCQEPTFGRSSVDALPRGLIFSWLAGSSAAPGHTPGHSMYMVESDGQKLLLRGDIVHVAAVQFDNPAVAIGYDVDVAEAESEHWRQFANAAGGGYLIGGAHIPFPGLGHVRRDGDKVYTYVPLNYSAAAG
jgi:hypothetical protein